MTQSPLRFVSIDPGAQGAIAYFDDALLSVEPLPSMTNKNSKGRERVRTCPTGVFRAMKSAHERGARFSIVEDVWGIGGQGAGGAAALGYSVGVVHTACAAAGLEVVKVAALRWKAGAGLLGKKKPASVLKAREVFGPECEAMFQKVRGKLDAKDVEGLAEAALIGRWYLSKGAKK
jgi:hypothetical protein